MQWGTGSAARVHRAARRLALWPRGGLCIGCESSKCAVGCIGNIAVTASPVILSTGLLEVPTSPDLVTAPWSSPPKPHSPPFPLSACLCLSGLSSLSAWDLSVSLANPFSRPLPLYFFLFLLLGSSVWGPMAVATWNVHQVIHISNKSEVRRCVSWCYRERGGLIAF